MAEVKISEPAEVNVKASKKLKTLDSYTTKSKILEGFSWLLLILYMTPFYLMFINSFKTRREIFANTTGLPSAWNFKNYADAMDRMGITSAFTNSIIITVGSVLLILLFSSMAAWVLVRDKSTKSKIVFYIFTAGMIVPFQAVMLPLVKWMGKINFGGFNMLGTHYGLMFMYLGFGASMSIFLYHGFIKGIPEEIEEAAIIDGCSKWQVYTKIVLPLLKPTTVTVAVLNSIWIWNDFLLPFLTINGKLNTIPLAMNNFFGAFSKQWELAMAALILAIIPIVIFYFFVQKQIIAGIVQGSIK
ncbi:MULTISPECIES: carbohydrate ABC transporter permease [Clostridium]|jgi:raffinose/stachyose/melibiose transport system permease protein|uniref:ABC transporter, permease protein n=3 Tax=Clostridium TaxID=1485 RepID=C4IEX7_CLOBU|nr:MULTISPECIES: carbohydrate ABC transporter permease [Clostridium]ETI91673.1 MAG: Sugar ABC transporter, permease protein [Clostridium butyricum DORA_1]APF23581.1 binding--dependent transport system inner membrane component family protein [Clostridium butyricum]EDT74316.1 sugar ABC transporter, permease protein [Clostridium butyricum 5521]EEP55094.1 ABC transporter, permease protein [Clostridium butyricum E4 str. BoNT E BL5262]KHD14813.1 sugar ABC transporter permease [Clostridium butyricum]